MTRPTFVHPRERLLQFADSAEGHSSGVADDIRNLLTDLDRMTDLATTASTAQVPRPRPATVPTASTGDPLRDAIAVLFTVPAPHERFWGPRPQLLHRARHRHLRNREHCPRRAHHRRS